MELIFHTDNVEEKIILKKGIVSIQSNDTSLVDNFIKDYNVVVIDNLNDYFVGNTVLDEISSYVRYPELSLVAEMFDLIGFSSSFFDKEVSILSTTEKVYLNIFRNLAKLNDIILFKDIFLGLDLYNQKNIIKIINHLKDAGYNVFITSNDVDILYKLADYSLVCSKNYFKFGKTDDIYTDVKKLLDNKLDVPTLSYITYKAKEEKNVKLFYSKDVRDIIKDIYKHV